MKHGSVDGRVLRRGTHSRRSVSGALYLAMRGKRTEKNEKGGEHAKRVCGGGEGSVCGAFRWARESENKRDGEKKKKRRGGAARALISAVVFSSPRAGEARGRRGLLTALSLCSPPATAHSPNRKGLLSRAGLIAPRGTHTTPWPTRSRPKQPQPPALFDHTARSLPQCARPRRWRPPGSHTWPPLLSFWSVPRATEYPGSLMARPSQAARRRPFKRGRVFPPYHSCPIIFNV
jgi:hypothetical protein